MAVKKWISLYIYYSGDTNHLLRSFIAPYIKSFCIDNHNMNYFFVKYFEDGPHLRLRLEVEANSYNIELTHLITIIQNWVDANTIECDWWQEQWLPINSVIVKEYEPEHERYGGILGLDISEQYFKNSSKIVLHLISNGKLNDYNDSLTLAFNIQLITISVFCKYDINMVIQLLEHYYYFYSYPQPNSNNTLNKYTQKCQTLFLNQKDTLVPYIRTIWENINTRNFEDGIFLEWLKENIISNESFDKLDFIIKIDPLHIRSIDKTKYVILLSCIHMTNNRLGINNIDEGLLFYFLKESLKC